MRLLISVLMIVVLTACGRHPAGGEDSEKAGYHPLPRVEVSIFTARNHIASAYVRHSGDAVLFRLSSENPDDARAASACARRSVMTLSSVPNEINFSSHRYEGFDQSFDMFKDGTVVLVPLPEDDGEAMGVFVNLVSGKRYFFAPSVRSTESLAKIRWLSRPRSGVTVIVPEDRRAQDQVPPFPEFQR